MQQSVIMKVAIEGCSHGDLDAIYSNVRRMQEELQQPISLLLCCGDFQCTRDGNDLNFLCCPPKYRQLNDFPAYYKGEKKAPILTIFIGGNHEASNVLRELYYGGWVAPNIFYLGHAGVIRVGGLRIAGLSGIYKLQDYRKGHYEKPPSDAGALRTAYHVREFEVSKLQQIRGRVDIMLSHDWPESIYNFGNKEQLLRCKPHFDEDVQRHSLGNPHTMRLLQLIKPSLWFAAHLHVQFAAVYVHPNSGGRATRFLALDKVLPHRRFLHIIEADPSAPAGYRVVNPPVDSHRRLASPASPPPSSSSSSCSAGSTSSASSVSSGAASAATLPKICYDVEWLAILRANQLRIPTSRSPGTYTAVPATAADVEEVRTRLCTYGSHGRKRLSLPLPKNSSSGDEVEEESAAEAPAEAAARIEPSEASSCFSSADASGTEEDFEWPHWESAEAPFRNLSEQRRFLLRLLGFDEQDDILWRADERRTPVCWQNDGQQQPTGSSASDSPEVGIYQQQQQQTSGGQQQQQTSGGKQQQPQQSVCQFDTLPPSGRSEEVDICCYISEEEDTQ